MKVRNFTQKDKKVVSELYYELHPVEEKENKEKGLLVPIEKSKIKSILLVAEENKEIVGFILAHFIQYGFFRYGTIDEFFVKKEFRGRGVGKKLIKEVMRKLQRMNVKMIIVGTEKENKGAIKLYKKVGFEVGKKKRMVLLESKKETKINFGSCRWISSLVLLAPSLRGN